MLRACWVNNFSVTEENRNHVDDHALKICAQCAKENSFMGQERQAIGSSEYGTSL